MALFPVIILLSSLLSASTTVSVELYGGQKASLGQFPYQVAIYATDSDNNTSIFSGTIIDRSWILTAGHCTYQRVRAKVIAGSVDLSSPTTDQQVVFINNKEDMITHPEYSRHENDIALIHLRTPLNYTDHIKAVTLGVNDYSLHLGENATVSGFGRTSGFSESSTTLRWTPLKVVRNSVCTHFNERTLCTIAEKPASFLCEDSGSPLVLTGSRQIGLLSFGKDRCKEGPLIAFTKINKNFIESRTGKTFG